MFLVERVAPVLLAVSLVVLCAGVIPDGWVRFGIAAVFVTAGAASVYVEVRRD